jgi:hypothetical protein
MKGFLARYSLIRPAKNPQSPKAAFANILYVDKMDNVY